MNIETLILAIAILFVLEGLAYAAFPGAMKRAMGQLLGLADERLRFLGFVAIFVGLVVIWFIAG